MHVDKRKFVWIIIPVHNRREMTKACLKCLAVQHFKSFKIIVVDDSSTDGTSSMISSEFPQVILLEEQGELFWTKSINLGIRRALREAGTEDYVLTLNNDLLLNEDYLDHIVESGLKNPDALVGSVAVNAQDRITIVGGGVKINWLTAKFRNINAGKKIEDVLQSGATLSDVDALPGRGTLIPVRVIQDVGLFDEIKLPHYGADYDFSLRAKRKGYALKINYRAAVFSHLGETGLNNAIRRLSWISFFKSFFSIRSPNNLYYRFNFARSNCPKDKFVFFYLFDIIRVISGSIRNQFLNTQK